jgi:molybdenum cofactor guanylyltransferase
MKLLGAIIAGGKATRFGGDKAAALLNGKALIEHVADALRPQVGALIICGRDWPGLTAVADRPAAGMGPLGGLCAALHYGAEQGFDAVMTAGCDVLPVPALNPEDGTAVIANHYLFGIWPAVLAPRLDHHLSTETNHSMRHWIATSGAQEVPSNMQLHNLNTPADFLLYSEAQGLAA